MITFFSNIPSTETFTLRCTTHLNEKNMCISWISKMIAECNIRKLIQVNFSSFGDFAVIPIKGIRPHNWAKIKTGEHILATIICCVQNKKKEEDVERFIEIRSNFTEKFFSSYAHRMLSSAGLTSTVLRSNHSIYDVAYTVKWRCDYFHEKKHCSLL